MHPSLRVLVVAGASSPLPRRRRSRGLGAPPTGPLRLPPARGERVSVQGLGAASPVGSSAVSASASPLDTRVCGRASYFCCVSLYAVGSFCVSGIQHSRGLTCLLTAGTQGRAPSTPGKPARGCPCFVSLRAEKVPVPREVPAVCPAPRWAALGGKVNVRAPSALTEPSPWRRGQQRPRPGVLRCRGWGGRRQELSLERNR